MAATKAVRRRHWYLTTTTECVLCGRGEQYRERQYGRRPKNPMRRYVYEQFACSIHFM